MTHLQRFFCFVSIFSLSTTIVAADTFSRLDAKGNITTKKSACIKDNASGLVWELKAAGDSIRGKDKTFRWGGKGADIKEKTIAFDDWSALVADANKTALCGFKDWRVPHIDELKHLYSQQTDADVATTYFPDTLPLPYWSVSSYSNYPEHAQTVHFGNGASYYYHGYRGNALPVRLVRGQMNLK